MEASQLALTLTADLPAVWARGRPAPSLSIQLMDEGKGCAVTTVSGWRVTAAFVDQAGMHVPFDAQSAAAPAQSWEIVQGHVLVEGLPLPLLPSPDTPFHLSVCVAHPSAASRMVRGLVTPAYRVEDVGVCGVGGVVDPANPQLFVLPFASSLALRTTSELETVWYADRHFPSFDVELFDRASGNPINTSAWKIQVSVLDAFGQRANHVIHEYEEYCTGFLENGKCSFSGIRFNTVSSKAGGHYRLMVHAVSPDMARATCQSVVSDKIQILSYRLYHAPKVPLERLTPFDAVAKMPGIGTLYAKRFAALGVAKVGHLAAVDTNALGEEGCNRLLCSLRKERGSMTLAKLTKYINQARDIVSRWEEEERNRQEDEERHKARDPSPPVPAQEPTNRAQLPVLVGPQEGGQFQPQAALQQPQTPTDPHTPESDIVSSSAGYEPYPEFNEADLSDLSDLQPSCGLGMGMGMGTGMESDLQLVRPSLGGGASASMSGLFEGELEDNQRPAKRQRIAADSIPCSFRVVQIY